jgi:hypothetical protein
MRVIKNHIFHHSVIIMMEISTMCSQVLMGMVWHIIEQQTDLCYIHRRLFHTWHIKDMGKELSYQEVATSTSFFSQFLSNKYIWNLKIHILQWYLVNVCPFTVMTIRQTLHTIKLLMILLTGSNLRWSNQSYMKSYIKTIPSSVCFQLHSFYTCSPN